jgi:type I restriction enzyme S subunit
LQVDQLVFRKITAWESPIAIVTSNFDGYFVSPEFPTFTLDKNQISPGFMSILYKTEQFKKEMQARCTGTLLRRMRLNPSELLKIPVSLPPLDEQKEVVLKLEALQNTLSSIAQHLNSTRRLMKLALEKRLS